MNFLFLEKFVKILQRMNELTTANIWLHTFDSIEKYISKCIQFTYILIDGCTYKNRVKSSTFYNRIALYCSL